MGISKGKYIDLVLLTKLLEEDRDFGRIGRIAKEIGAATCTVRAAIKRLDYVPPYATHEAIDRVRKYRNSSKEATGMTPKARDRAKDPRRSMVRGAKDRAREKGMDFDLHPSDVVIPEVCPILGIALVVGTGTKGGTDNSPSIDRVDNSRGYTWDNVLVVSRRANMLKNCATLEELHKITKFYTDHLPPTERLPVEPDRKRGAKKLTQEQEQQVKSDFNSGTPKTELAAKYNVSVTTIDVTVYGRPDRKPKTMVAKRRTP
jgi:hypothetical protein